MLYTTIVGMLRAWTHLFSRLIVCLTGCSRTVAILGRRCVYTTGIVQGEEILSVTEYWLNHEFSNELFCTQLEDEILEEKMDSSQELFVSEKEKFPSSCGILVLSGFKVGDGGLLAPSNSLNDQTNLRLDLH